MQELPAFLLKSKYGVCYDELAIYDASSNIQMFLPNTV